MGGRIQWARTCIANGRMHVFGWRGANVCTHDGCNTKDAHGSLDGAKYELPPSFEVTKSSLYVAPCLALA